MGTHECSVSTFGVIAVCLAMSCAASADESPDDRQPKPCSLSSHNLLETARKIRGISNVPALSAAILVKGQLVAKGTVGVRILGGEQALDSDQWHIGSISKSVTATLAARLIERKLIALSTTIEEIAPNLLSRSDSAYKKTTIYNLLTHRSGLGENPTDPGIDLFYQDQRALEVQRRDLARLALSQAPGAAPGVKFVYANDNYIVLGSLLETVTKQSWENLTRGEVFGPLNLTSAGFGPPGDGNPSKAPVGHKLEDGKLIPVSAGPRGDNPAVVGPAGTVHMSVEDLARFAYFHAAGEFEEDGYLSPDTYRAFHKNAGDDVALGWFTQDWRGHRLLTHTGSNGAWYAMIVAAPDNKVAIASVSNVGPEGGGEMAVAELVSALTRASLLSECLNPE